MNQGKLRVSLIEDLRTGTLWEINTRLKKSIKMATNLEMQRDFKTGLLNLLYTILTKQFINYFDFLFLEYYFKVQINFEFLRYY